LRTPVVILGTGGSGTRVLADILESAGYFLGAERNRAGDFLGFYDLFETHVDAYLERTRWVDGVTGDAASLAGGADMSRALEVGLAQHRASRPAGDTAWGWKAPRSIFLLPFLHAQLPELTVIHLVRDGRDMAYSKNQNQLQKHGRHLLAPGEDALPEPQQSILLWSRINTAAADYGEQRLAGHYLRVRYEDLCAAPEADVQRLFAFLGVAQDPGAAAARIRPSPRSEAWKSRDAAEMATLVRLGQPGLRRFGYA